MAAVRDLLNQVWSAFRSAGIADDLTIIEHIAALFLTESGLELPADEASPRFPTAHLNTDSIKGNLRKAANQVGGFATLFDRHVLFRLPTMLPGGRYPTPRHIAQSMLRLAQVEPTHSFGDFACGSAGLLVYRETTDTDQSGQTIGVEISPEWAKLARANIQLHRIPFAQIRDGNALKVLSLGAFAAETFDRILMNPPFGEKIDAILAEITLGKKVGSRSETALTTLALQKLASGGRAAVLVPSGLLFSNNTADKTLRTQLVDENALEALISLPRDAFQPYSPLQTNLLVFSKTQSSEGHLTWFLQVEQDGYPAGKGRDLTQDPPQSSDLPFVEQVWAKRNSEFDTLFPDETNPQVGVKWITDGNSRTGMTCQGLANDLASIKFMLLDPQTGQRSSFLLVELAAAPSEQRITVQIPLETEQPSTDDEQLEAEVNFGQLEEAEPEKAVEPLIPLLSHPVRAVAIALPTQNQTAGTDRARLLGVAVQSTAIQNQAYDLRPERYVKTQTESRSIESPTTLLARIYRNQRQLAQRIDSLFGRLELPPIATQKLPSPIKEEVKPFGKLSAEQIKVWEKVREKTETVIDNETDNYQTAALFTLEELSTASTEEAADATKLSLDLLERMGVIVPVTVADPKTNEPLFFYRRVTKRDLWQFGSGASNSGEDK